MKFVFLEHTADIKFKCFGKALNEIFENAALALADYSSGGKKIKNARGKIIEVIAQDNESLLYNFLDELLYLIDAENFIVSKAQVLLRGNNLRAELFGDDASKYHLSHIKAATYSEMYIKQTEKGWEAQVVLDV